MEILRTPEDRFTNLPGFSWASRYADVGEGESLRMAYLDEGAADSQPVLLLHGEPSWAYLFRKMIPPLLDADLRVIAPDLIGFGRSDKPAAREAHSYAGHVTWLGRLLFEQLDVRDAVLLAHGWGGLLGLRLLAQQPDRFAAVVASNTMLPTGDEDPGAMLRAWWQLSQSVEDFPVSEVISAGVVNALAPAELAAYDAPFPEESYKAGPRQLPVLVPRKHDDPAAVENRAAWETLCRFDRPFVCAFGDADPLYGPHVTELKRIPGATGQPHATLKGSGHFVPEDAGDRLAEILIALTQRRTATVVSSS